MNLKCGIVGLPNVGKSTLFNALTSADIEAQNFPFCTIESNKGIVAVPDGRLEKISDIVNPRSTIPATIEFVDIAGLVKGASKGEGLGNQFLSHIRETQAIIHVVRCFEENSVPHVHNKIDPVQDIEVVETELLLADIEIVTNAKTKIERKAKIGDKEDNQKLKNICQLEQELKKGIHGRDSSLFQERDVYFKDLQLITMKPCLYLANIEEENKKNVHLLNLEEYAKSKGLKVLPLCNQIEAELAELNKTESLIFMRDLGIQELGLNKLIHESYELLELITFFSAEPKEVRAWTVKQGVTATKAAKEIHTDFEKGFIRAETLAYEDFIEYGGERGAKLAGKLRSEGSDYLVKDGDIIHFRFNI